jgi:hypothetical protein
MTKSSALELSESRRSALTVQGNWSSSFLFNVPKTRKRKVSPHVENSCFRLETSLPCQRSAPRPVCSIVNNEDSVFTASIESTVRVDFTMFVTFRHHVAFSIWTARKMKHKNDDSKCSDKCREGVEHSLPRKCSPSSDHQGDSDVCWGS